MINESPRVFGIKHHESRKLHNVSVRPKPICPICNQKMYYLEDRDGSLLKFSPKKKNEFEWKNIEKKYKKREVK